MLQKVIRLTTATFDSFWEVQYGVWQVCHNLRKSIQTRHKCIVLTHNTNDYRDAEKSRKCRKNVWSGKRTNPKKWDRKNLQVQLTQEKFSRPLGVFYPVSEGPKHGACFWHCIVSVFAVSVFYVCICFYYICLHHVPMFSYVVYSAVHFSWILHMLSNWWSCFLNVPMFYLFAWDFSSCSAFAHSGHRSLSLG